MRILSTLFSVCLAIAAYAQPNVMISEIADPNDNSSCRFVEIICKGAGTCDMTDVSLKAYFNGNTTVGSSVSLGALGILQQNDVRVIARSATPFFSCYGFNAAMTGAPDSNGDDVITLEVSSTGQIIDAFGVIGVDGTGTCHEFEDGSAVRKGTTTQAQPTFDESEWTVSADSNVSGCTDHSNNPQDVIDMTPGSSVLPVEFVSFEAALRNNNVNLTWTTATEKNNAGFDIERSVDGRLFESLGFQKGEGDSYGNIDYTYTDYSPAAGLSYYRLKQIDFDGRYEYSNIAAVQNLKGSIKVAPSNSSTYVTVSTSTDAAATVNMYNSVGMLMQTTTTANGTAQLNLADLRSGIYFVQIAVEGQVYTEKIFRD